MHQFGFVGTDKNGFVIQTHLSNDLEPPAGNTEGQVVRLDPAAVRQISEGMMTGKRYRLADDGKSVYENLPEPAIQAPKDLAIVRRAKLRQYADEMTKVRDRGLGEEDAIVPIKGLELARFVDVFLLYNIGDLKADDRVWVRNWDTGHHHHVKVSEIIDAVRKSFHIRQELNQIEQHHRDEVEHIAHGEGADTEKAEKIDALEIPAFFGIAETAKLDHIKTMRTEIKKR